jgi:hypothetical protein
MKAVFKGIVSLLMLLGMLSAISMVAPQAKELTNGDTVYLGEIGPGQTIEMRVNPWVTTGGLHDTGGLYDTAMVISKPNGWESTKSPLYANPMWITITADPNAVEGDYYANITIIDENYGEKLNNITFTVRIKIKWDILDMTVSPTSNIVGPNQPAIYKITITNKGAASDDYEVKSKGAKRWEFKKAVFVPSQSSRAISYEMAAGDEETYKPTITVVSRSSHNIHKEQNVTFTVRSDLFGDLKAINNGVILFPVLEAPIYALGGLISNLFG